MMLFVFGCFLFFGCKTPKEIKMEDMIPLVLAKYGDVYFESIPYNGEGTKTTQYGYDVKVENDNSKLKTVACFSITRNVDSKTYFNTYISADDNFDDYYFEKKNYLTNDNVKVMFDGFPQTQENGTQKRLTTISGTFLDETFRFSLKEGIKGENDIYYYEDNLHGEVVSYTWKKIKLCVEGASDGLERDIISKAKEVFRQALCEVETMSEGNANCIIEFHSAYTDQFNMTYNNEDIQRKAEALILQRFDYDKNEWVYDTYLGNYIDNHILINEFYYVPTIKLGLIAIGFRFGLEIGSPDPTNLMNTNKSYTHLNQNQWDKLRQNVK
jgi:hypothetical protein